MLWLGGDMEEVQQRVSEGRISLQALSPRPQHVKVAGSWVNFHRMRHSPVATQHFRHPTAASLSHLIIFLAQLVSVICDPVKTIWRDRSATEQDTNLSCCQVSQWPTGNSTNKSAWKRKKCCQRRKQPSESKFMCSVESVDQCCCRPSETGWLRSTATLCLSTILLISFLPALNHRLSDKTQATVLSHSAPLPPILSSN
ncbi:uncharacterized protein LOC113966575 isoform X2 [Neopelma chrysocephalum]|uniref:uncharacterized protein LOC113966575 isoform X2 n=1 Tax=Neopelma chrysocephalum TaxID=114329 RepID=UPI000FCCF5EA|nr:uncharacterized protein LOC113966575 isoform X2 [Neopelma chrysocephalum]